MAGIINTWKWIVECVELISYYRGKYKTWY